LSTIIRPFVYADTNKFYTNQNFETNLSNDVTVQGGAVIFGLKSFISERRNSLMTELSSLGCFVSSTQQELSTAHFELFPNPANTDFAINFADSNSKNKIAIYNSVGQLIYKRQSFISGEKIDCSQFASGLYLVVVNDEMKEKVVVR
jgi:hypothetical protein